MTWNFTYHDGKISREFKGFHNASIAAPREHGYYLAVAWTDGGDQELYFLETPDAIEELGAFLQIRDGRRCPIDLYERRM